MADIFTVKKAISDSKAPVLPKSTPIKEKYEGSIRVIEAFNQKSEVNESDWQDELAPDRPFAETINAINQDPRLNLSNETYIQMILGKGLKVTAKKENIRKTKDNDILLAKVNDLSAANEQLQLDCRKLKEEGVRRGVSDLMLLA